MRLQGGGTGLLPWGRAACTRPLQVCHVPTGQEEGRGGTDRGHQTQPRPSLREARAGRLREDPGEESEGRASLALTRDRFHARKTCCCHF